MTGKIQFGVASGAIAQVIVPALTFSPEGATGTDPMPPGTVTLPVLLLPPPLLEPPLLQAASTIMLAIARAQPCDFLVAELRRPSLLALFAPVIRPRVIRRSPFSRWLPVIRSATSRGTESQYRPTRLRPVSPAHPDRLMTSRPVSYRVHELAEA